MFGKLLLLLWYIENYEYYANKTETDYRAALKSMELFFDASIGTSESDEADILCLLIDEYEKQHYPIEAPDPIETIKIRMEEM